MASLPISTEYTQPNPIVNNAEKSPLDPTIRTTSYHSASATDVEGHVSSSDESYTAEKPVAGPPVEESEYPSMPKTIAIMSALYLVIFLVALDRTIIATAIPRITDEFNDAGQVGCSKPKRSSYNDKH